MTADDSIPRSASEDQDFLRAATELLAAGQYERLAELLHQVQLAYDRRGDTIPAHVLVLARRICLACSQSQAEADWHQQACEEAAQREDKLRHQLTTLLDLVSERDLSVVLGEWDLIPDAPPAALGPPAPDLPEPVQPPSLWQRIQGALHWRLRPQPVEGATSEVPSEGPEISTRSIAKDTPGRPLSRAQAMEVAAPLPSMPKHETDAPLFTAVEKRKEPGPPSLAVYCLGPFRVYQDDRSVDDWPSNKGKAIFKYLVTHRERPVIKEVLMELFWPGANPDAARNSLNVAIYGLRQALRVTRPDFSHVLFQDDHYLLNPTMGIWVDAEEFIQQLEAGQSFEGKRQTVKAISQYEIAEGLYQGDFLEEDLYEDWPMLQREGLKDSYLLILELLSRYYLEREKPTTCIRLCQKILAKDNCREDAHRRLMRCYSRQGQSYLALRQYHLCVEALQKELEAPTMDETLALFQQIRAGLVV